MHKIAVYLFALLALLSFLQTKQPSSQQPLSFEDYQLQYQKTYTGSQQTYRRMIFQRNLKAIQNHNADPFKSYQQGINKFTDLTPAEFAHLYLSPIISEGLLDTTAFKQNRAVVGRVGVQIDWVAAGKVRPVQDQGHQCGASWAFSAIGAIQSAYMIKGTQDINLSQQELLDCSGSYGNFGCNGGYMSYSFKYVKEKGISSEKDYPYTGKSQRCANTTQPKWSIDSYRGDSKGCDFLLNAITNGPVSVAVDATNFYSYKEGIFNKCGNSPNSGALVVGVTDAYWLIKMSFGSSFGDKGYVRIASGNTCAVCEIVSYPIV